jgi:hypothetical protein
MMPVRSWIRALSLVLLLNACFMAAALSVAGMPRDTVRERVREGFATGILVQHDWVSNDTRRGMHQYDECLILQMLTNAPAAPLTEALGPRNLTRNHSYSDYCRTLHELVVQRADVSEFTVFPYTRYWHGYLPATAGMLRVVSVDTARRALHGASYLSCLLLVAVSLRRRGLLRVTGAAIGGTAALFWGLPYYGQLFAHAPGDIVVMLGIAALVAAGHRLLREERLIMFSAAFGALVVYFEFLTGQLPTAVAFLFAAAYALASDAAGSARPGTADGGRWFAWRTATVAVAAFAAGAALTLVIKQALAAAALGPGALSAFSGSLQRYMGSAPAGHVPDVLRPFSELYRWGRILTYNSTGGAAALFAASALAWLVAAAAALRLHLARHDRQTLPDLAALAVAASVIVVWVLVLQNHTFYHARFMVRIAMVPVALSAAAAAWTVLRTRHRPASRPAAAPTLAQPGEAG